MVANKYGNLDKDRLGKEVADKALPGPGSDVEISAKVGGVSNRTDNPSQKDTSDKGQNRGSKVSTPSRDGIPPYVEGGFRNAAMEHKR
jgi:hypothetical protein